MNIGKFAFVVDKESIYHNSWGIIKMFDGEYYHLAISNDDSNTPIFKRNELIIPRNQQYHKKAAGVKEIWK